MQMLKVTIKTPTKIIFDGEAENVTLPTSSGNIQILSNHQNLITLLDIGVISLADDKKSTFICIKGIATVRKNLISILTEEALRPENEILQEIQTAIKSAEEGKPTSTILAADLIRAEKQLRYYLLKEKEFS